MRCIIVLLLIGNEQGLVFNENFIPIAGTLSPIRVKILNPLQIIEQILDEVRFWLVQIQGENTSKGISIQLQINRWTDKE